MSAEFLLAMSKLHTHLLRLVQDAWPWLPPEDLAALFEGAALEIHASCKSYERPFDVVRYAQGIPLGQAVMKGVMRELLVQEADG